MLAGLCLLCALPTFCGSERQKKLFEHFKMTRYPLYAANPYPHAHFLFFFNPFTICLFTILCRLSMARSKLIRKTSRRRSLPAAALASTSAPTRPKCARNFQKEPTENEIGLFRECQLCLRLLRFWCLPFGQGITQCVMRL